MEMIFSLLLQLCAGRGAPPLTQPDPPSIPLFQPHWIPHPSFGCTLPLSGRDICWSLVSIPSSHQNACVCCLPCAYCQACCLLQCPYCLHPFTPSARPNPRELILEHKAPVLIEAMTYRGGHHSTSDDAGRCAHCLPRDMVARAVRGPSPPDR